MTVSTVRLQEVCEVIMGQAPQGSSYNTEGEGLPLLAGAGDLGEIEPSPSRYTNAPTRVAIAGDIILCVRATLGRTNWARQEYCLGRGVAALRAIPEQVDSSYLWHWIGTQERALDRVARGSTFRQVTRAAVEDLKIPLPPLPEQRRIAAILDKADAVRRKRQQTLDLADQFLRSAFLDLFGDPVTNPKGWPVKKLGDLIDQARGISYGIVQRGTDTDGGVPVVRISNIATNSFARTPVVRAEKAIAEKYQRTFLKGEELLVSIRGTVGRVAIAPSEAKGWNVSREIAVVPVEADISLDYLHHALLSDAAQRFMLGEVRGIAQRGINLRDLRNLPIPIPEQAELDRWDGLLRGWDCIRSAEAQHTKHLEDLAGVLVQRAFRGEL